jgi:hypothetical protein
VGDRQNADKASRGVVRFLLSGDHVWTFFADKQTCRVYKRNLCEKSKKLGTPQARNADRETGKMRLKQHTSPGPE